MTRAFFEWEPQKKLGPIRAYHDQTGLIMSLLLGSTIRSTIQTWLSLVKTKAWIDRLIDRLIDLIMSEPASAKEMSSKSHHPDVMCNRTQRILC